MLFNNIDIFSEQISKFLSLTFLIEEFFLSLKNKEGDNDLQIFV